MSIELGICLVTATIGAYTDWTVRKVRNNLVFPVLLMGLLWHLTMGGWAGARDSALGAGLPLILFPFFALRMLGAGDIKLLMALGAWLGVAECTAMMIFSILCGGVVALGIMLIRRDGALRVRKLWHYMKSSLLSRKLFPYTDFDRVESGEALPFALAILGGLICLMLQHACVIPPLI